ncbi:MAG: ABC transporter permease [Nitrospinales bacterium]
MRIFVNLTQALRGLRTNRGNAVLMMLGMAVGVASLTFIVAVGEGAKTLVMNRISKMGLGAESFSVFAGAGRLFFKRPGASAVTSLTLRDADDIQAIPNVRLAVPGQRKRMRIIYKKRFANAPVYGMIPGWQYAWQWSLSDGRYFAEDDMRRKRRVAILGVTPLKKLFGSEDPIGKMIRVNQVFFEVIGVLRQRGATESGFDHDDFVAVPLSVSASRLLRQTHLHSIRVVTIDPNATWETIDEVKRILRRNHKLSALAADDFRFITPRGIMEWVTEMKRAMDRTLALISTLSLLVGGIVIMNIMQVSIQERIREIGIRRCFGASRTDITLQFLFESTLVSLLGGAAGLFFVFAVSVGVRYFGVFPATLPWEVFALAFSLCLAIGVIFGIQPARKAAFLSPEETLR